MAQNLTPQQRAYVEAYIQDLETHHAVLVDRKSIRKLDTLESPKLSTYAFSAFYNGDTFIITIARNSVQYWSILEAENFAQMVKDVKDEIS